MAGGSSPDGHVDGTDTPGAILGGAATSHGTPTGTTHDPSGLTGGGLSAGGHRVPTFVLNSGPGRGDLIDWTGDLLDVVFDQIESLKPIMDYIWIGKLGFKIVTRLREFQLSPYGPLDLFLANRPISVVELWKLDRIIERRFYVTNPDGTIVVVVLPMWGKDP